MVIANDLQLRFRGYKYLVELSVPVEEEPFDATATLKVDFLNPLGCGSFASVHPCTLLPDSVVPGSAAGHHLKPYLANQTHICVKLIKPQHDPNWNEEAMRLFKRELLAHSSFS